MTFTGKTDKKVVLKLESNYFSIVPKIPKFDATADIPGLEKKFSIYYADKNSEDGSYKKLNGLINTGHELELRYDMIDVKSNKSLKMIVEIHTKQDLDNFYEKVLKPPEPKKK
ncbi:MAG: hypothetical protein PHH61_00165 [Candidatus Nanoarchaeia archaeon]|nr:hypothetical protein [Candidatus Nanoarchaeia archaeon]